MRRFFGLASSLMLALGTSGMAMGQETAPPSHGPRQALQRVHGPRTIDQELDHLTRNLELTSDQQRQVRPLLQQHHDRIQVLCDSSPTLPRQALAPRIHAISDDTHHQIEALLTDRQKHLARAMQQRMHAGEDDRRRPM